MKSNDVNLNKLTKRPIQYWFEDGISELVMGALYILIGINFYIQAMITSPATNAILSLVSVLIIWGGVIITRKLIGRIKEHFIYPRTGYVSYRKKPRQARIAITILILVAVAILGLFFGSSVSTFDWTPIVTSTICAALMIIQAVQTNVFRLYIESIISVFIGIIIAFLDMGGMISSGIFFMSFGLVLMFGGSCAFLKYLKNSPSIHKMNSK